MSTYIDEAEIVTVGTDYNNKKPKKNHVINHFHSDGGIQFKDFLTLVEGYEDALHKHRHSKIKVTVEFIDND